jgi:hypothetical protein
MTRDTYVSGEAVSVLPIEGAYERAMFMPPNSGANASFLGTVRELLVHERVGARGEPVGLDLAFATPNAWLADGKQIEVHGAPTSFGNVSYSLNRTGAAITGQLVLPPACHCRLRLRVPAGEHVESALIGSTSVRVRAGGTIELDNRHGTLRIRATVH